jgi:GNAT superfamily N-acetyltransferase
MATPSILTADPSKRQRVISTVITSFTSDPIARWVFPDAEQYLTYFPQVVTHMGGAAFDHDGAFHTDDFSAASLWLPPNVHPDQEALGEVAERAIPESEQEKVFGFLEQMDVYHPKEPHWYLPFIGVDPVKQGLGYGSSLLKHVLPNCDRDKLPAYLEATSPGSRRLYERHGFKAIGEIQSADSPPLWPMLRQPS